MAKIKVKLSKANIAMLSRIQNPTERNRIQKELVAEKLASIQKNAERFKKRIAFRKVQFAKPFSISVQTSKKGQQYVVIDGGGLFEPTWLNAEACENIFNAASKIGALGSKLPRRETGKPADSHEVEVDETDEVEVDETEVETA